MRLKNITKLWPKHTRPSSGEEHPAGQCGLFRLVGANALLALALTGCGDQPPGCADAQVARSITDSFSKDAVAYVKGHSDAKDEELAEVKLELVQITTDGYDASARLHSCSGTLNAVNSGATTPIRTSIRFTVQGIEGKAGEFVVRAGQPEKETFVWDLRTFSRRSPSDQPSTSPNSTPQSESQQVAGKETVSQTEPGPPGAVTSSTSQVAARQPASWEGKASPSFSCTGSLGRVEKLICESVALSSFDASLAKSYAEALQRSADPTAVKQKQRAWIKERNACADEQCLTAIYGRRADELTE